MIVGVQLDAPAADIVSACLEKGLLLITAGVGDVVRLVPPLVVSREEIDVAVGILSGVVNEKMP